MTEQKTTKTVMLKTIEKAIADYTDNPVFGLSEIAKKALSACILRDGEGYNSLTRAYNFAGWYLGNHYDVVFQTRTVTADEDKESDYKEMIGIVKAAIWQYHYDRGEF